MKEGRYKLTSEVEVMVDDIVKFERVNSINNKVMTNVDNDSDGDGKETISWSVLNLVDLLSKISLVFYSSSVVLSG